MTDPGSDKRRLDAEKKRLAEKRRLDAEKKLSEKKRLDAEKKLDAALTKLKTQAKVHSRFSIEVEEEQQQLDHDLSKSMRTLRESY